MYLNLGMDTVIRSSEIVGIFDLENTSISARTRLFLKKAEENGQIINASPDLPATFVLTRGKKNRDTKVYISQLSPATLKKRLGEQFYTGHEF